jgi:hypothetical protein
MNYKNTDLIRRKCDICFQEVDESYKGYVMHVLENHNPFIARDDIADPDILQSVLTGVIVKKKCDICKVQLTTNVFDYINHIKQSHSNMLNAGLFNFVKDKYVVSMCLKKNVSSQSSNFIICNECQEEVNLSEFNNHIEEHEQMKQLYNGFYGSFENPFQSEKIQNNVYKPHSYKIPENINIDDNKKSSQKENSGNSHIIENYPLALVSSNPAVHNNFEP